MKPTSTLRSLLLVLAGGSLLATLTLPVSGQMAATSNGKFVGNILRSTTTADPVFDTYWNQATPENSGKWGSVEGTRDVMNWAQLDFMYAYTRARGIPFKLHTLVWGQQYPAWITTLNQAEQREEVEEWIAALAARYPDTEYIDVVNEPLPGHAPAPYRDALGGAGATGWDWVIWSFEKARQYFPNAKLLLNDYNIINSDGATTNYLTIINLLKDRGLIDGIGEQAHFYETTSLTTLQNNLNRLAATGLPIHISELDINLADDTAQSNRYQQLFPVLWTHPAVRGITFWGYKQGLIWRTDGYLLRTDGSERPAMAWLKNYIAANPQSFSASVASPANGQAVSNVLPVSASATVTYGSAPFTVTFQSKLASETEFTTVSSDTTAPYTADLGNLPVGAYQVRVLVTDSDSATVTSTPNSFNVFPSTGGTWLGISGTWDDPGIWAGGTIADGADSTASFTGVDIAADQTITLNGNRTIGNIVFTDATTPSHNLSISGADALTLDLVSGAPVINVTQTDRRVTVSSVVAGNDGLQKAGSGTLALSGNNSYTGTTTVSSGTLRLEGGAFSATPRNYSISPGAVLDRAAGEIPTGTTTISGSGTFRVSGGGLSANSDGRDLNLSMDPGGLIDIQAGGSIFNGGWQAITWTNNKATLNVDGSMNLWDGQAVFADALTGAGLIESTTGQSYGSPNLTLGVNNGSGTFSGNITAAGARAINLTKTGTGTQTFSGSTTFKGTTTISGGTLQFAKTSSLYAGVTTDWVKTKITVNNGGTIAFNVGGTDEFTTGNVTTLLSGLGGAVSNNGLRAGSTIAFDTTNASGGGFTVADSIANSTGTGGGAVGLAKLGTGTLVLAGNNTYTGGTTVGNGTLLVNGSTSASSTVTVGVGGVIGGTGTIGGTVVVNSGGTTSPGASIGTLSAGATTWNDGSSFRVEIADAIGTAGTGWDQLDITGTLDLSALSASGVTIDVDTLAGTIPGPMANFDPYNASGYDWQFATASGGIAGFDAAKFHFDPAGFANFPYDGTFAVAMQGNSLYIAFRTNLQLPDPGLSTFAAAPLSVPADGVSTSTITVTLRDATHAPIAGMDVELAITAGPGMAVIVPATIQTTDVDGVATFTVSSATAGTEEFTAKAKKITGDTIVIGKGSVAFTSPQTIISQTLLIPGYTPPPPPPPDAPQTSLAATTPPPPPQDFSAPTDGQTAPDPSGATDLLDAAVPGVIRVTEYYLTDGDFAGTVATLTLDQELVADYFILVRGSRVGNGLSMPDSDYVRVAAVPGGQGGLADAGAADRIGLRRAAAEFAWEGVVTVVECLAPNSPAGFRLVDAVVATLSGTSGSQACAPWGDATRVVPFGGYRGGGVELPGATTSRYQGTSAYVRLAPGAGGTLDWVRDGGGETLSDAVMTTFVVEWGAGWTVQHASVAGSSGGDGAAAPDAYTTAAIAPVARANTWVWGTGIRADAGIGDCAESCLVALGDGVNQNATESTVAVGSEYPDAYSFDVYALTHPALAVDHRFKPDGDLKGLDIPVAVAPAAPGARFAWLYNGCNGTSSRFPRPRMWSRYTAGDTVTISRGYDGAEFPAWIQGIDFSGLNAQ